MEAQETIEKALLDELGVSMTGSELVDKSIAELEAIKDYIQVPDYKSYQYEPSDYERSLSHTLSTEGIKAFAEAIDAIYQPGILELIEDNHDDGID